MTSTTPSDLACEDAPIPLVRAFALAMSMAPHASLLHDSSARLIAQNDRADRVLGTAVPDPDGSGLSWIERPVWNLPEQLLPWAIAASEGADIEQDLRVSGVDGIDHWVTAYSRVTDDGDGVVVLTSLVDTTVRQQWVSELLDDFRGRFVAGWQGSAMPMFLVGVDGADAGRFVYANEAMHALAGASDGSLPGRLLQEQVESAPGIEAELGITELLAEADGEQTVQTYLRRHDGTDPHPVMLGLTVFRGQLGRPAFLVGFAIDHEPLAEATRARHQALLRDEAMYEQSADLVVVLGREGTLDLVGPSVESMLGHDRDGLLGVHVEELLHPDDRVIAQGALERALQRPGRGESVRVRVRHASGDWLNVEAVPTSRKSHPELHGLVVTIRDRSREEEAERRASELDERARQIVENAADGIWVLDADNLTTYVNPAMAAMLGTTPGQMHGRELFDFMDDVAKAEAAVLVARRRAGIEESFRFSLLHADGRTVRTFVSTKPLLDNEGNYAGAAAWVTDETDRLESAERLANSASHLRALLGAFPDTVVRMDGNGTFLEVHAGESLLDVHSSPELVGRTVHEVFPESAEPAVALRYQAAVTEALRTGDTTTIEFQLGAAPQQTSFEVRCSPVARDEVIALVRDVTDLRRAEAARIGFQRESHRRQAAEERLELERELERAGRLEAMGHLAGGVAHDVNNLLGVIANYASAIERSADGPRVRADTGEIRRAVERGAALTRQLLLVGRTEGAPCRAETDVRLLVEDLVTTLRRSFPADAELVVAPSATACVASVDRGRLEQAIMNLVVNGRDAIPQGGRVVVEVWRRVLAPDRAEVLGMDPGATIVVSVTDNGDGMSDEVRSQAFQPFFTTKDRHGTGIGLTIVKNVAEEHSGAAEVSSSATGSTVSILIPESESESESALGSVGRAIAHGPGDTSVTPVVLLVDDDADVRRSTARLMEDLGVEVLQASSGLQALQQLGSTPVVDLLVTDVRMPEMNGPELAQRVHSIRPGLPVVYVTGFAEELLRIEPGAIERLLTKPYDVHGLTRVLERALGVPLGLPIRPCA